MRTATLTLILAAGLALALLPARGADDKAGPDIDEWIARLGSSQYAEREAATTALATLGPRALDALRAAAQSTDPEVRRRARELVRRIEKQAETAALLRPQRIRLVYQDAPVGEAVMDFAKTFGFTVQYDGDPDAVAARRITLDTGEVTFWEAFDRLCAKAGLTAGFGSARPEQPSARSVGTAMVVIQNGNVIAPRDIAQPAASQGPLHMVFRDGQPPDRATCYAGNVRIQALPPGGPRPGEGEVLVGLDVTPEPGAQWQRIVGVRIDKAIDDEGQTLTQKVAAPTQGGQPVNAARPAGVIMVNGMVVNPEEGLATSNPRRLLIRLAQGEKSARVLKELSGTIAAVVQTPPQPLVIVDNLMKAGGQTVKGEAGASLKVLEATRLDNGQVKLRLLVEAPPGEASEVPGPAALNRVVRVNGRVVGGGPQSLSAADFTLLDGKDRPFRVVRASNTGKRAGSAQELEIVYQMENGGGEPEKLVYRGRKTVVVDVPFTLRDVPVR